MIVNSIKNRSNKMLIITILFYFTITQAEIINIQSLPNGGRRNAVSGSIDNKGVIFIAGGSSSIANIIDVYNATSNSWYTIPFPDIDSYATNLKIIEMQEQNTLIIIQDGYSPIYIYNGNTNGWTKNSIGLPVRNNVAVTSLTKYGLAFFAGGYFNGGIDTNKIEIFDITTNNISVSYLSLQRRSLSAISLNNLGLAFFIGGYSNSKYHNVVDIFDAKTNSWTVTNFLSAPRSSSSTACLEKYNMIFIAGGSDQTSYAMDEIDIYNANTKIWTTAKMSITRYAFPVNVFDDEGLIFFSGGLDKTNKETDLVDIYNINTKEWKYARLKEPVNQPAASVLKKYKLFILAAGTSGWAKTTSVNAFSPCLFGTYLSINPTTCTKCPAGYYCPDFNVVPISCPQGNYCPEGSGEPQKCPVGTYGGIIELKNISQCLKCPIGTFNSLTGQTPQGCLTCSSGSYCDIGSTIQTPCPSNYYCPVPSVKIGCPMGTYYDGVSGTSIDMCQQCNKGFFCPTAGKSSIACVPGTYSDKLGSTICEACPEGSYCGLGASEPTKCLINSYSVKGSSACTPCGAGKYTEEPGSSRCLDCVGGQFDVSGWWCMTLFDKILFVFVWGGSILSGVATLKKARETFLEKKSLIEKEDLPLTIKNLIFIERIIENKKNNSEKEKNELSLITISNNSINTFSPNNLPKFNNLRNQDVFRKLPRLPRKIKTNIV